MVFSSLAFLFLFLPVFLLVYVLVPGRTGRASSMMWKNAALFLFSLVFYAWGEPVYVFIMLGSSLVDYTAGWLLMHYRGREVIRRCVLITALLINLSLLGFFKYGSFFMEQLDIGSGRQTPFLDIALPVGISFYTFQTMSYTIDRYRERVGVQKNLISFGAYVASFPQLIAGPIVTYAVVEKEIDSRRAGIDDIAEGIRRFIAGFGKKVLLANNIGMLWKEAEGLQMGELSMLGAWLGIISFAFQIYFDFSGYSDMAIGLGRILGFHFPENFNFPYLARSASQFWRRWHITLGSWFREYVYIPLGGNRNGILRTCFNLLIVWLLTGLWHGASWNFVLWGLYYGILIVMEKLFLNRLLERLPGALSLLYLWFVMLVGWVFFAIEDFGRMGSYLCAMAGFGQAGIWDSQALFWISNYGVLLLLGGIFSAPFLWKAARKLSEGVRFLLYSAVWLLSLIYLVDSSFNPFLYFRF